MRVRDILAALSQNTGNNAVALAMLQRMIPEAVKDRRLSAKIDTDAEVLGLFLGEELIAEVSLRGLDEYDTKRQPTDDSPGGPGSAPGSVDLDGSGSL